MADTHQTGHRDETEAGAKAYWLRRVLSLVGVLGYLVCQGCGGRSAKPSHIPPAPPTVAVVSKPDAPDWREVVRTQFRVIAGGPGNARRAVIVVQDENEPSPGLAPSYYDATLSFAVVTKGSNPASEAVRLYKALDQLGSSPLHFDLWARGVAGLIVRHAVERIGPLTPLIDHVVFVDTPHRGVSPSGWPGWQSTSVTSLPPQYAVSGSPFIVDLNRSPIAGSKSIHYINVWRDLQPVVPRATVMGLPRPAVLAVLRPSDTSLWSIFDSEVIALRRVVEGSIANTSGRQGPTFREEEIKRRAPRAGASAAPSFPLILDNSVPDLAQVSTSWLKYGDGVLGVPPNRGPPTNPFARMTDAVSVGYDPDTRSIVISGFEDFSRDPLNPDFFFAALDSFRQTYPAISIDPPAPGDPPNLAPVRYVGSTQGTLLGGLMFEADRVMKTLALGKDNVTQTPIGSDVPGYRSIAARGSANAGAGESMWRLWFEPERWHVREQGRFAGIVDVRLRCRWERMTPNYAPSQDVVGFTENLTTEFSPYSLEQPSLGQLDQAAIVVAMARWVYEANLRVVPQAVPSSSRFSTPTHTPLIEVENRVLSGPYSVTRIMQGGVVLGAPLRRVRDDGSQAGHLMAAALQSIPRMQEGIAVTRPRPPTPRAKNQPPPPHLPRPPTVSWGYSDNGFLLSAVAFSAERREPKRPIGISNAPDLLTDPAYSSDQFIAESLPILQPTITGVFVDDALDPPEVTLTGVRFGREGTALFDGRQLPSLKWTPEEVVVAFPAVPEAGTLVLRSANRDSNPVQFMLVPGSALRDPPKLTVTNHTQYLLHVEIHPVQLGSTRSLDVPAGLTSTTRLLPGHYSITAQALGQLIVGATKTEDRMYERGYTYSLVYESSSFQLGEVIVNNNTGAVLTLTVGGQTVSVPPGQRSSVRVPFGTYSIGVNTRCGSAVRNETISPASIPVLSYECRTVIR